MTMGDELMRICGGTGKTIIFVTHRPDLKRVICGRSHRDVGAPGRIGDRTRSRCRGPRTFEIAQRRIISAACATDRRHIKKSAEARDDHAATTLRR